VKPSSVPSKGPRRGPASARVVSRCQGSRFKVQAQFKSTSSKIHPGRSGVQVQAQFKSATSSKIHPASGRSGVVSIPKERAHWQGTGEAVKPSSVPSKGPRRGPARVVSGCQGKALVVGLPPCSRHSRQ
jgi:hypothetical protein